MKLIIPMAGMGKRLRPFTLAIPKPLLNVAGKSIVQRIIEDLNYYSGRKIEEVHFVIGNFGEEVEKKLIELANKIDAKGFIHYQLQALGTAHAVYCAKEALRGEVCIAFADTLYGGNIKINDEDEAIIWTYKVDNPEAYGVVIEDGNSNITDFVEKPKKFVSNKAIVGMYYFSEGDILKSSIREMIDKNLKTGGEFQLTDSLKDLKNKGTIYKCKTLNEWIDFGNPDEFMKGAGYIVNKECSDTEVIVNESVTIHKPVYIGKNVKIRNSEIGPNVIIEDNSEVTDSVIKDGIIGRSTLVKNSTLKNSMIGNNVKINKFKGTLLMGDYNEITK